MKVAARSGAVWCLAGVALAVAAWVVVVPWDMSTVDAAGNDIPGRSDGETGPRIAVVLAVVMAGAVAADVLWRASRPIFLAVAGSATWAFLFAWRAAVSRVGGANMWPIAFVMLVLPAAVLGSLLVWAIVAWRRRSGR